MRSPLGSIKKTQGIFQHRWFNNHKANPIRPNPRNAKDLNKNQMVPQHIQQNKVEKTNVEGVVGLIRKGSTLIHHRPQPPTLTPISLVPIVMHMGVMLIIVSYFTQNYNMVNHRTPMLIMAKVLGKAKKGKL
jgi:hypothetical protein